MHFFFGGGEGVIFPPALSSVYEPQRDSSDNPLMAAEV